MTTIIRVKRHRNEDPHEALILSCKRKKIEDNLPLSEGDSFEKILNFSGTIEEKDDKIAASTVESFVKSSKYSELKSKGHAPDIRLKQRKIWKERSEGNRLTLLSCLRSSNGFENTGSPENLLENSGKDITIVDVSKEETEKESQNNKSDNCYVYDLYSAYFDSDTDYKEFNNLYKDNLVSVQPWNFEWDYEYRDAEDENNEMDPDEDDSNDENNWRNDYPDSDPDNTRSMDDDDDDGDRLARLVKGINIDDDYDLSSDSDEEKYLNYEDGENYYYYEAEDLAGKKYAKFKANAMKQFMDKGDGDDEEDDDYSVKEEEEEDDDDDDFRDCEDFPSGTEDEN